MCQLASEPIYLGHSLLDQHFAQRDREKEVYSQVVRHLMRGHMEQELYGGVSSLCSTCYVFSYIVFFLSF